MTALQSVWSVSARRFARWLQLERTLWVNEASK